VLITTLLNPKAWLIGRVLIAVEHRLVLTLRIVAALR
jgi:hypothetical protein